MAPEKSNRTSYSKRTESSRNCKRSPITAETKSIRFMSIYQRRSYFRNVTRER